jgi:sec-independent protein translocase protein TatB
MFDIGWSELLVLGAIALIVVGPKDLPMMLRRLGQFAGQARRMAREFQRTLEDAAEQADVKELRDVQKSMADWNRTIGGDAPRKYAERFLNDEDETPAARRSDGEGSARDPGEAARGSEAERGAEPAGRGPRPVDAGPAPGGPAEGGRAAGPGEDPDDERPAASSGRG